MPILADQIQSLHVAGSDSEISCGSIRFRAYMWWDQIQSLHMAASDSELAWAGSDLELSFGRISSLYSLCLSVIIIK